VPNEIRLVIRPEGIRLVAASPQVRAALGRLAASAVNSMKRHCPVSPSRFEQDPRGYHLPGDYPLAPSGTLRRSIGAYERPDGSVHVGPTASYAEYVNDGTRAHTIRSHGSWPLRSPATGQVFGPIVHHPGTRGAHFLERTVEDITGTEYHIR
jgi:Bacteriophage HK97-gp10, putative tail-component